MVGGLDAQRLVFVDEMGTNISLAPLYAWAPRGRRAYCSVPRNRGPNTTLLASMTQKGMGPCLTVEGSITSEVFEIYLERVLAPEMRPGQVVVMDNLSAHKGERMRELIEARGCELLYLPPYSPNLNPIEEALRPPGLPGSSDRDYAVYSLESVGQGSNSLGPMLRGVLMYRLEYRLVPYIRSQNTPRG
jgi:hypothetical protein